MTEPAVLNERNQKKLYLNDAKNEDLAAEEVLTLRTVSTSLYLATSLILSAVVSIWNR